MEAVWKISKRGLSWWKCLIDGFAKRGELESAERLFEEVQESNVVSLIVMFVGFYRSEDVRTTLGMFDRMDSGVRLNSYTWCVGLDGSG